MSDSSVFDASVLFAALVSFAVALVVDVGVRSRTARLRREQRRTEDLRAAADRAVEIALADQGPTLGTRPRRRRTVRTPLLEPRAT